MLQSDRVPLPKDLSLAGKRGEAALWPRAREGAERPRVQVARSATPHFAERFQVFALCVLRPVRITTSRPFSKSPDLCRVECRD
jgi:hypothetical protein